LERKKEACCPSKKGLHHERRLRLFVMCKAETGDDCVSQQERGGVPWRKKEGGGALIWGNSPIGSKEVTRILLERGKESFYYSLRRWGGLSVTQELACSGDSNSPESYGIVFQRGKGSQNRSRKRGEVGLFSGKDDSR